jgi:CDP-glycerol glycerophosphotransferase
VDSVEWRPGERLRLTGRYEGEPAGDELLLECRGRAEQHAVAISHDTSRSRFTVELAPGRMPTMAGELPLQRGVYEFLVRRYEAGVPAITSLSLDHRSLSALPQEREIAGKSFAVGAWAYDDLVLQVGSPRGGDHAGGHHQRRLQAGYRRGRVRAPLRDAVIYDGRHLGPYAGNLRALHEELVRREAPVEHLWVVTDDAWAVPDTARVLPAETAAYYDAYASARFLLAEGRWPEWYTRRPDQVSIQTGYASPVKLVGADVADRPRLTRDLRRWARQDASKTLHAVSAGPFATGILSRVLALANGGELLETGAPAHDLMVSIDRAEVRSRLGLAPDQVVVLFAPTYRDNLRAPGGYWMGPTPDLESMRAALGEDHLVLMRKHWSVVDPVPFDHTGFVRDVSRYPDVSDLLVAADVVVSDYSSLLVQQAAAGRPTVLYTPDLDGFRNDVRGLYIDDGLELPGPVVSTTEQLVRTIQERRALEDDYRSAVTRFASLFCPLADGKAASRVVDRLIG